MAWDYDQFNDYAPVKGQVVTADGNYQAVTCIVTLSAAVNCATLTWTVEESSDGGTTYGTPDGSLAIYRVATSGTSAVFHASTLSKAGTVQFKAFNSGTELTSGSTPSAAYTILLGHPLTAPFLGAQVAGVEDGYTTAPTR